ncbi:hypothetical protein S40293_11057 [Stachybotrys chartarum IBT 40293]|nr:hypothetical protein S40293_11057 [Stachybotrys chartarum IBT 40293]
MRIFHAGFAHWSMGLLLAGHVPDYVCVYYSDVTIVDLTYAGLVIVTLVRVAQFVESKMVHLAEKNRHRGGNCQRCSSRSPIQVADTSRRTKPPATPDFFIPSPIGSSVITAEHLVKVVLIQKSKARAGHGDFTTQYTDRRSGKESKFLDDRGIYEYVMETGSPIASQWANSIGPGLAANPFAAPPSSLYPIEALGAEAFKMPLWDTCHFEHIFRAKCPNRAANPGSAILKPYFDAI